MNIVLEGPDASGKSTLARYLSQELKRSIVPSEGPEKFPGEINERIRRYRWFDNVIFDRHPCISQGIYSIFNGLTPPDRDLVFDFYETKPVLIYCMSTVSLDHQAKGHDSEDHLKMIEMNNAEIRRLYDQWGLDFAHFIYRVGSPMARILRAINGHMGV